MPTVESKTKVLQLIEELVFVVDVVQSASQ